MNNGARETIYLAEVTAHHIQDKRHQNHRRVCCSSLGSLGLAKEKPAKQEQSSKPRTQRQTTETVPWGAPCRAGYNRTQRQTLHRRCARSADTALRMV